MNNPIRGWLIISIFSAGAALALYLFGWIALGVYGLCAILALLMTTPIGETLQRENDP
jgi:hypothetical protein